MKNLLIYTAISVACLWSAPSFAGSPIPYPYSLSGNVVNTGSGACLSTSGTFPARLTLFVDSVTGNIDDYYLSIQIQNPAKGLVPQNIVLYIGAGLTGYLAYDPQLLGSSTALTGVFGTVVSGGFTTGLASAIEVGSGFGTTSTVPLVLSSGSGASTCGLSLSGVLYAVPN